MNAGRDEPNRRSTIGAVKFANEKILAFSMCLVQNNQKSISYSKKRLDSDSASLVKVALPEHFIAESAASILIASLTLIPEELLKTNV